MKNKLLIVGDDVAFCDLLADYLAGEDFDVETAHNGRTAIDKIRTTPLPGLTRQHEPFICQDIFLVLVDYDCGRGRYCNCDRTIQPVDQSRSVASAFSTHAVRLRTGRRVNP